MRVAVLMKWIPVVEHLRMVGGRLVRDGVPGEVNAYCRRANAKAVQLVGESGGEAVVFTMGPPAAEEGLREMIACGADRGVHLCDPAFAGADSLATARALAAAVRAEGPFDLVLAGLNSLDADTGQVGPEVAALLGLPFVPGIRDLTVAEGEVTARVETDDGYATVRTTLPLVLSAAERLVDPSKAPPERRAAVDPSRITTRTAADLGLRADEVGLAGSPTWVGEPREVTTARAGRIVASAAEAVAELASRGALAPADVPEPEVPATGGPGPQVWVFLPPDESLAALDLLGAAAGLAATLGGSTTAVVTASAPGGLGPAGADRVLVAPGGEPEEWAAALGAAAAAARPWALLVDGSRTGRAVAAAVAATHGWGLTGDALELEVDASGRLVAWKAALGGLLLAPIHTRSDVQLATVRAGVLPRRRPRRAPDPTPEALPAVAAPKVRTTGRERTDDDPAALLRATSVVAVGRGVPPEDYAQLEPLLAALGGAVLGATRKVTDSGWLPRSRQIGITGLSVAPRLLVSVGASGRPNHALGFRRAGCVLAVNGDPSADVFEVADIGLVGDWRELVPALAAELAAVGSPVG